MAKHKVIVEITVDDKGEFLGIKVPGAQSCPLPKDAPAPRRLVKDLLAAALESTHEANRDSEA
jgi:hypothetical protein